MRLPKNTLPSRLTRARAKLAEPLGRRGLVLPAAVLATALAPEVTSASLLVPLVSSTVQSALIFLVGPAATGGTISAFVAALTEGVLQAMLRKQLRRAILGALLAGFVFTGTVVSTQALTPKQKPDVETAPVVKPKDAPQTEQVQQSKRPTDSAAGEKGSKVRALLKERLKILRARVDRLREQQRRGIVAPDVVRQADLRVYKAELDLCATDQERIAVHEKIVGVYKEIEDQSRVLLEKRAVDPEVVNDAVLNRLEAEINLERLREKASPPAK